MTRYDKIMVMDKIVMDEIAMDKIVLDWSMCKRILHREWEGANKGEAVPEALGEGISVQGRWNSGHFWGGSWCD